MGGAEFHGFGVAEVLLDVGLGAEQALLFAAPQGNPHGAVEFEIERLEDAHDFNHDGAAGGVIGRSEEHTSELQSHVNLVCRLLLEKKNIRTFLLCDASYGSCFLA